MVEACLNDAKEAGMHGVAVVIRDGPWLADRRVFLANGFELVDTAPPDYELLIRKLKARAADPVFKRGIPGFKWLHGLAGGRREWIWFGRNPG